MAKFDLVLKGYVGASDFNLDGVLKILKEKSDQDVKVLIDSTGGSLRTGLSIAAAFKNHGAVDVCFTSLNASAATIASLGARSISIDRNAMYLVHKCSIFKFAFADMNADDLNTYIGELTKDKQDLDKIDDNIAAMYASRCKKEKKDLVELMKKGAWLNAKEALEWGFVDKITDSFEEKTVVSAALAEDFMAAGIPLPGKIEKQASGISTLFRGLKKFLEGKDESPSASEIAPENVAENVAPEPEQTNGESAPVETETKNEVTPTAKEQPEQQQPTTSAPEEIAQEAEAPGTLNVVTPSNKTSTDCDLASFMKSKQSALELFNSLP